MLWMLGILLGVVKPEERGLKAPSAQTPLSFIALFGAPGMDSNTRPKGLGNLCSVRLEANGGGILPAFKSLN